MRPRRCVGETGEGQAASRRESRGDRGRDLFRPLLRHKMPSPAEKYEARRSKTRGDPLADCDRKKWISIAPDHGHWNADSGQFRLDRCVQQPKAPEALEEDSSRCHVSAIVHACSKRVQLKRATVARGASPDRQQPRTAEHRPEGNVA